MILSHEDFLKLYGVVTQVNQRAAELAVEITATAFSGLTNSQRSLLRLGSTNNPLMNEALRRAPTCPQTPPAPQNPGSSGRDALCNARGIQTPHQDYAVTPVHVLNRQNPPSAPELIAAPVIDTEATTESPDDDEEETDVSSRPAPLSKKRYKKNKGPVKKEKESKD